MPRLTEWMKADLQRRCEEMRPRSGNQASANAKAAIDAANAPDKPTPPETAVILEGCTKPYHEMGRFGRWWARLFMDKRSREYHMLVRGLPMTARSTPTPAPPPHRAHTFEQQMREREVAALEKIAESYKRGER